MTAAEPDTERRFEIMNASRWILLAGLVGTGCVHAPQPYVFNNPKGGDAVLVVAKSLVRQGHKLAFVDHKNAEVVTYWEDTKYRFRETDDYWDSTNIFLRYHVRFGEQDKQIRVTAEAQRCVPLPAEITPTAVMSTCYPMDFIFATQQREVEQLGQNLAAALATGG
jgi:hypothetical protein